MEVQAPSPQTTLLILLGASAWPFMPEFQHSEAFANAARRLKAYFLNPRPFGLPAENLLDLFDFEKSADELDVEIGLFLRQRLAAMKATGNAARDLLLYFIGHGGFVGPDSDFFLAIRRTRVDNPRASGLPMLSLADTLTNGARYLRRIIVLDCCFAAAAFSAFQAGPDQVALEKTRDAFQVGHKAVGVPTKGTTLLCSSNHKSPSLLLPDGSSTMFTKAFLDALVQGVPSQQDRLTLRDVKDAAMDLLSEIRNAPKPVVHSPDQSEGDVADIPFFPNPRIESAPQAPLWGTTPRAGPAVPPFQAPQSPPPSYSPVAAPPPIRSAGGIPSLEISNNIHPGKKTYELTKQVINIGRDPTNDIVIDSPIVSGFHAQIVRDGNQLILVHPHPTRQSTLNGLFYQGRHIAGNEQFRKPLARGDLFRIGDEHGTLVTLAFNDGSGAAQDIVPEIRPIPLGAALLTIGRAPDNMVVLNHPQISDHHARLEQVQGGYRIVDLNSTSHVYVNGQQVSIQLLTPGDEVRIGPFKLIYTGTQFTQHDERGSIRIDALHLKKVGTRGVILIDDISIAIPPRKFVALLGGVGSGKTTLLDALSGVRPAQLGVVLYNGQDYYGHLAAFGSQVGYIPQDVIIHGDLTVERALHYAAKLRLPEDFTGAQIRQRIDEVLKEVEMESRRNVLIKKLPDWQRKHVSVALELLSSPSVFFLDEPTLGLDPDLDRRIMFLLRKLADKGGTVVLVTHATNNINSCDYVCFLAQGGRLAYYGPPEEAKVYFNKTDFAEIYSALKPTEANPNIPAQAEEKFKASTDFQKYVVAPLQQGPAGRASVQQQTGEVTPPKRGNPRKQFWLLSSRFLELLWNDKGNLAVLLLQAPVIGIILFFLARGDIFFATSVADCPTRANITDTSGPIISHNCERVVLALITGPGQLFASSHGGPDAVLNQAIAVGSGSDAQKILFIMAIAAVLFGCINGFREISKEVSIYRRERIVNLGIVPYLFSKIAILGILCLLQSAVLVLLVQLKAPLQRGVLLDPVLEIYITLVLTSLAGLMLGLMVSAIDSNSTRLLSLISILVAQVIFSGIIFPLDNFFLKFLGIFFAAGWAIAGMGTSMGLHSDKLGQDDCSYVTSPNNCAYRGDLFVSVNQGAAQVAAFEHLLLVWFALIVMCVALAALTAYFLKRKDVRG